jgi:hypothetical protein
VIRNQKQGWPVAQALKTLLFVYRCSCRNLYFTSGYPLSNFSPSLRPAKVVKCKFSLYQILLFGEILMEAEIAEPDHRNTSTMTPASTQGTTSSQYSSFTSNKGTARSWTKQLIIPTTITKTVFVQPTCLCLQHVSPCGTLSSQQMGVIAAGVICVVIGVAMLPILYLIMRKSKQGEMCACQSRNRQP